MKLRIGITGGIGAGKSVVAALFELHGIPVYNADLEAKRLMESNLDLHNEITGLFGDEILTDHVIDRRKLSALVFNHEENLQRLNALVHPYVIRDFERWEKLQNAPYTLREAAILFETGIYKLLDHTILVDAPESLRLQRVLDRDQRSKEQIKSIFSRQWTSEKKRPLAWRIIENDEQHLLIPQVNAIHNELMYA